MGYIFISYKREEVSKARQVRQALRGEHLNVWWDENLQGGQQWAEEIDNALLNATVVVVLLRNSHVHEEHATTIATCTQHLRELMSQCTMLSIAQSAATELWLLLQRGFGGVDMHSPYRQVCHILGITLTSAEHSNAPPITKEQWQKAKELSTRIFDQYGLMYFRKPSEMQRLSDEERHRIKVTMCMFLQYLGAPPMRSEDQLLARVKALYVPFDDVLRRALGFSASDFLRLLHCIKGILQRQFARLVNSSPRGRLPQAVRYAMACQRLGYGAGTNRG